MKTSNLRVHVIGGHVWYQATEPEPCCFSGGIYDFIADGLYDKYESVRMVGMRCNAELITLLYHRKMRVEVCTPMIVETRADRLKPGPVLFELGLCSWGPSQGGFHEVSLSDYHAYALAAQFVIGAGDAQVEQMLHNHVAWKPLSFIKTINQRDLFSVLAHMIDPRWYIDMCYPDRGSKFNQALGLHPYIQRTVTDLRPVDVPGGWSWLGVLGPLTITSIILFVTGIPPLERSADAKWGSDPAYQGTLRRQGQRHP